MTENEFMYQKYTLGPQTKVLGRCLISSSFLEKY